jgi:hypothetical protein
MEGLLASSLQSKIEGITVADEWGGCGEETLDRAKIVTACPAAGWRNIAYLRENVSIWRQAEDAILSGI